MRSRTPGAFSQLSAFASAFLALPVTSRYASDLVFPLATISANFSCLEPAIYRLGLLALRGGCCLAMRDGALDCGGFCADLLNFVGIADKLLLSKAGCKRAIVNRKCRGPTAGAPHRRRGWTCGWGVHFVVPFMTVWSRVERPEGSVRCIRWRLG